MLWTADQRIFQIVQRLKEDYVMDQEVDQCTTFEKADWPPKKSLIRKKLAMSKGKEEN